MRHPAPGNGNAHRTSDVLKADGTLLKTEGPFEKDKEYEFNENMGYRVYLAETTELKVNRIFGNDRYETYGIKKAVPHRALEDAELISELISEVNSLGGRIGGKVPNPASSINNDIARKDFDIQPIPHIGIGRLAPEESCSVTSFNRCLIVAIPKVTIMETGLSKRALPEKGILGILIQEGQPDILDAITVLPLKIFHLSLMIEAWIFPQEYR